MDEGTILLVVGKKDTKFHIHAHKLSEVSTFFKAALESGFKEAGERMITLSEDVETVDCFVQWVYHQKIDMLDNVDPEVQSDIKASTNRNCNLYIFADKYDIPRLKRYATTNLFTLIWECQSPAQERVKAWYQQTSATCGLRRLLRDWYLLRADSNYLASKKCRDALIQNPEFSADLVGALCQTKSTDDYLTWKNMKIEDYL